MQYQFAIPSHARAPYPGCKGRGVVYARVSHEDDGKKASLQNQAQGEIDGLVGEGYYLDETDVVIERYSGVNSVARRDGLLEILKRCEQGRYAAMGVFDPDRLVRGIEVVYHVKQIESHGVRVYFDGVFSEPNDERDLLLAVKGYSSGMEVKMFAKRSLGVRRSISRDGKKIGNGGPRYGWSFDKSTRLTARNELAEHVVRIFTMARDGSSTIQIARVFNAEGIPAPGTVRANKRKVASGEAKTYRWSAARVGFIVREPAYMGKAFRNRFAYKLDDQGRPTYRGKDKVQVALPRDQWVEESIGDVEPIVSPELWEAANRAIQGNRTRAADRTRNLSEFYLLRGHIFCGACREKMVPNYSIVGGKAKGHRYKVYRCRTKYKPAKGKTCGDYTVFASKVEAKAREIIDELLRQPGFVEQSIDLAYRDDGQEAAIAAELGRTEEATARLEKLLDAYASDLDDADLGARSRKAIRDKMVLSEAQLEAMQAQAQALRSRLLPLADRDRLRVAHKDRAEAARARLAAKGTLSDEDYRLALEGLGLRIFYLRGEIDLELTPGVEIAAEICGPSPSFRAKRCNKYTNHEPPAFPMQLDGFPVVTSISSGRGRSRTGRIAPKVQPCSS